MKKLNCFIFISQSDSEQARMNTTNLTEHQILERVWRMNDEQIDERMRRIINRTDEETLADILQNEYKHEVADEVYYEFLPEGYEDGDDDEEEMTNFEERCWGRFVIVATQFRNASG